MGKMRGRNGKKEKEIDSPRPNVCVPDNSRMGYHVKAHNSDNELEERGKSGRRGSEKVAK